MDDGQADRGAAARPGGAGAQAAPPRGHPLPLLHRRVDARAREDGGAGLQRSLAAGRRSCSCRWCCWRWHAHARTLADYHPVLPPQYRNPWDEPRFGRILEDLDSLAGYVAFEHWWGLLMSAGGACDERGGSPWAARWEAGDTLHAWGSSLRPRPPLDLRSIRSALHPRSELEGEAGSRPPLCVTASVEAIELHSSRLDLHQDMQVGLAASDGGWKEGRGRGGVPRKKARDAPLGIG